MLTTRKAAVLLGMGLMAGCGSSPTAERPPAAAIPGPQTNAVVATLAQQGASVTFVEVMPSSSHPYFGALAARYQLNGENLYAFEYGNAPLAAAEAARIAPDGRSIGNFQVDWVSDPHFYRSGAVIALYVGRQASTLRLLEGVLGPQVAGAAPGGA